MEQQKTELEIEQRIEQLKKITRKDSKKKYAQAQFVLGKIYYKYKKDWQKAIEHFLNIKKEDNPTKYAGAQLYLGSIYQYKYNNFEQAEQYYLNVKKKDNLRIYANVQLNLGIIYYIEKNNIEKSKQCFFNIKECYDSKLYANAQYNLGIIYEDEDVIEEAKKYFSKVNELDNPDCYARAQYRLGVIYRKSNIDLAIECLKRIKKQYNPEVYAAAQFYLAVIYYNNKREELNIFQLKSYFSNIKKQDNPKIYAHAQFFLGILYQYERQNIKQAERYYLNVEKQDDPVAYTNAQIKLGDNVFFDKTENKLKSAEEYYQNVDYSDDSFENYIIAQIMLSVIRNKNLSIFEEKQRKGLVIQICHIRELTIGIQKELLVKLKSNGFKNKDGLVFEREVAHYTKPEVLFNLLKNKPSDFRLNVIDFMNDPTENQILTDWLDINTENNNEIKTFLASFSFNHNSLNQFRLYGNENNIVGSSISLVFNKKFFGDDIKRSINPASINQFFNNTDLDLPIDDSAKSVVATMGLNNSNENSDPKNSEIVAEKNITSSVGSLPLFRCLYFDPKNGYISIAKRNKYSFYLEHQSDSPENIDAKWKAYLNLLKETETETETETEKEKEKGKITRIREKLKKIKEIIDFLKNPENSKNPEEIKLKEIIEIIEIIEKITNLDQLIALALMPISCLVKHAAFEDEDECRMIYITNIDDKNVQTPNEYAFINRLYLNYSNVEGYIEKIYLGPRCQSDPELWITNRAQTLKSNLTNEPIKVIKSQMPLR